MAFLAALYSHVYGQWIPLRFIQLMWSTFSWSLVVLSLLPMRIVLGWVETADSTFEEMVLLFSLLPLLDKNKTRLYQWSVVSVAFCALFYFFHSRSGWIEILLVQCWLSTASAVAWMRAGTDIFSYSHPLLWLRGGTGLAFVLLHAILPSFFFLGSWTLSAAARAISVWLKNHCWPMFTKLLVK